MEQSIAIGGKLLTGTEVKTAHTSLLVIAGTKGMLGCGYLNLNAAEKFGDALAIVRGVKNFEDMLSAAVQEVSPAAAALGVKVGISGRAALEILA